ncbi:MAG: hypothetical protein RH917_02435 [Lacipirellulaceae bacterium]
MLLKLHRRVIHLTAFTAVAMFVFPLHVCQACACVGSCQPAAASQGAESCDLGKSQCQHCTQCPRESEGHAEAIELSEALATSCCTGSEGPCECCLENTSSDIAVLDTSNRADDSLLDAHLHVVVAFSEVLDETRYLALDAGSVLPDPAVRLHSLLSVWLN